MLDALYIYLALNVLSFLLYGMDKAFSKIRHMRRIPEKYLLAAAALAPFGATAGMCFVRHKTKHLKFLISVPLFTCLHLITISYFLIYVF